MHEIAQEMYRNLVVQANASGGVCIDQTDDRDDALDIGVVVEVAAIPKLIEALKLLVLEIDRDSTTFIAEYRPLESPADPFIELGRAPSHELACSIIDVKRGQGLKGVFNVRKASHASEAAGYNEI